jgi:hypothetical protein
MLLVRLIFEICACVHAMMFCIFTKLKRRILSTCLILSTECKKIQNFYPFPCYLVIKFLPKNLVSNSIIKRLWLLCKERPTSFKYVKEERGLQRKDNFRIEGKWKGERDKKRQCDTERETERERQKERDRKRETERERQKERDRKTETERKRERQKEIKREK